MLLFQSLPLYLILILQVKNCFGTIAHELQKSNTGILDGILSFLQTSEDETLDSLLNLGIQEGSAPKQTVKFEMFNTLNPLLKKSTISKKKKKSIRNEKEIIGNKRKTMIKPSVRKSNQDISMQITNTNIPSSKSNQNLKLNKIISSKFGNRKRKYDGNGLSSRMKRSKLNPKTSI